MDVSDLDYDLPRDLIAQVPLEDRSASRMLVVSRQAGTFQDCSFQDLAGMLSSTDLLVLNNSRVFPARLLGKREGGGRVEVLLLRPLPARDGAAASRAQASDPEAAARRPDIWEALARPKRRLKTGSFIRFSSYLSGTVLDAHAGAEGEKIVIQLSAAGDLFEALENTGHIPLPPYVRRPDSPADRLRYQTVFASPVGSIAAPTAGLHFTPETFAELGRRGVEHAFVTLHVGYGTFRPIAAATVQEHSVDPELFAVSSSTAGAVRVARSGQKRLVAVGTTVTRVLEHWIRQCPSLAEVSGETNLFIYPPFDFRLAGGLLTNFHLPRSSLFALVCAFAGAELAHACYRHAVASRYRFYSYGDCMLVL